MFFYFNPLKSGVHLQWKLEVDAFKSARKGGLLSEQRLSQQRRLWYLLLILVSRDWTGLLLRDGGLISPWRWPRKAVQVAFSVRYLCFRPKLIKIGHKKTQLEERKLPWERYRTQNLLYPCGQHRIMMYQKRLSRQRSLVAGTGV